MTFGLGEVILREGQRADRVLILKDGECSVQKTLRPAFFEDLLAEKRIPDKALQKPKELAAFVDSVLASKTIQKEFHLCIANPGELLGFEAAVAEPFASRFSYVASRDSTTAYAISRLDFLRFFRPVLEETAQAVRGRQQLRTESLLTRLAKVVKIGSYALTAESGPASLWAAVLKGSPQEARLREVAKGGLLDEARAFQAGPAGTQETDLMGQLDRQTGRPSTRSSE